MLTHTQCKNAVCPGDKQRARLADAGGLYFEVVPSGSKRWFWKYYFNGKEKRLALGSYPNVGLKEARVARDDARKQQHRGADPVLERQVVRLSSKFDANATFEVTAREFHVTKKVGWSDHYSKRWLERISKDVFPWLGKLTLPQIGAPMLLQTLRRVESRGVRELPHSLLEACGQVFQYGVSTGRCERNPAVDLRGALKPVRTKHMSAILEPSQAGDLMRSIAGYQGQPATRTALRSGLRERTHRRRFLRRHRRDLGTPMLGPMGPNSRALVSALTGADLSNEAFPFGNSQELEIGYAIVRANRIAYVGELGWEIYIPAEFSLHVFERVVEAGAAHGLQLAGFHAMNACRTEKGYRHWGHDIGIEDTPLKAGLGFTCAYHKPGGFIGCEAVLAQKEQGTPHKRLLQFTRRRRQRDALPRGADFCRRPGRGHHHFGHVRPPRRGITRHGLREDGACDHARLDRSHEVRE